MTSALEFERVWPVGSEFSEGGTTPLASIRAYAGNRDLADMLAERSEDVRQVISGINGFEA